MSYLSGSFSLGPLLAPAPVSMTVIYCSRNDRSFRLLEYSLVSISSFLSVEVVLQLQEFQLFKRAGTSKMPTYLPIFSWNCLLGITENALCANVKLERTKNVGSYTNTFQIQKRQSQAFWFRPAAPRNGHGSSLGLYQLIGEGVRNISTRNCFARSLPLFDIFSKTTISVIIWK